MPTRMVLDAAGIAPSWDETSDSLAAWLVGALGVRRLILIKHVELPGHKARCEDLAATGIVDQAFARHVRTNAVAAHIFGPSDHDAATTAIRDGAAAGIAVE
jgi:aspartokinase-like uncharacterized kinase